MTMHTQQVFQVQSTSYPAKSSHGAVLFMHGFRSVPRQGIALTKMIRQVWAVIEKQTSATPLAMSIAEG